MLSDQDFAALSRRAAGRARYNRRRQLAATWRRVQLAHLLRTEPPLSRGVQARAARHFGVSAATISRDCARLLAAWQRRQRGEEEQEHA